MKKISPIIVTSTKNQQHDFSPNLMSDGNIFLLMYIEVNYFFLPNWV